jgi:transposase InsO family protein
MADTKDVNAGREMALFRYGIIAPVIQGVFPDVSAKAYYRRVSENPLTLPNGETFLFKPGTLEKWTAYYKNGSMDALMPKTRSDKGSVRVLSRECIDEIYNIKEKFPRLGATQIHIRLIENGFITADTSVRTIQRLIKNCNLKAGVSPETKDRKAFEEAYFGGMWQADTCYFCYIKEGGKSRQVYLVSIIDDHSRLIVGARFFYEDDAANFQILLKDAIATYGIPNKTYVDHGGPYDNKQLAYICGDIGTVLLHAPVCDGASKAKVERSFRTAKTTWLYGIDPSEFNSLAEFNVELNEYVRRNNTRVNSSFGCTPMDRFLASKDKIKMPQSREWLDQCFMNRDSRKVRKDATISFKCLQFDVPMQFIGQNVELRFLPGRITEAVILYDNHFYPLQLTDKVANGKTKRQNGPAIDYAKMGGGSDDV